MKQLVLMRHAKSSWTDPACPDRLRPLNPRGLRDAPRMGRALATWGYRFDGIVTSPATRAEQTACAVALAMDYPTQDIVRIEAIYEADAPILWAVMGALDPSARSLCLVGHHPGLPDLLARLTGDPPAHLPTAAVAVLALDIDCWSERMPGVARLQRWACPRDLEKD